MSWLQSRTDYNYFVFETTQMWGTLTLPLYYTGKWNINYEITKEMSASSLFRKLHQEHLPLPEYLVLAEDKNIPERVASVRSEVKDLIFEIRIEPSMVDRIMHFLNPVNVNQTYFIYRIKYM